MASDQERRIARDSVFNGGGEGFIFILIHLAYSYKALFGCLSMHDLFTTWETFRVLYAGFGLPSGANI